jgi:phosphohistidine phosphatase
MKLYFLRHGAADWPNWNKPDDERPLTKRGKKEMQQVAKFLARIKAKPALLLSSPLPRAWQTAEIAGRYLKRKCREEKMLSPGFGKRELEELLEKHGDKDLMIVGHEPDFTGVIAALTGASLKLAKGGVALVDVDRGSCRGKLLWLFPPKLAKV